MRRVAVEELKIGMVCDRPIYIADSDEMVVGANIPLSEQNIKQLMLWGISEISTEGRFLNEEKNQATDVKPKEYAPAKNQKQIVDNYNALMKQRKPLLTIHQRAMLAVEDAYECIKKEKTFMLEPLEQSADEIIKIVQTNGNVSLFLYGLGESKSSLVRHAVNTTFYAIILGIALGNTASLLRELAIGTLLINAGMVKMPPYIIHKQSKLTEQEFNTIRTHPLIGYKDIRTLGHVSATAAEICLQHHERFDGKGYPRGLKGNEISEFAKIAAIVDSYEAQIQKRSYKSKVPLFRAMAELISTASTRFDLSVLKAFVSRMSTYPVGSIVKLNDNSVGIVIDTVPANFRMPIIKMIFDDKGRKIDTPVFINLASQKELFITKGLDEEEVGINIFDVL